MIIQKPHKIGISDTKQKRLFLFGTASCLVGITLIKIHIEYPIVSARDYPKA
jgi:hypothetical protein